MGSAMAGRLVDAGYSVTVWNRTASRCDGLKAKGAKVVATPREAVESCDLVFACTSDPESARAVVFGDNGVLAAGDEALQKEAQPCFDVMGKKTFFLGEVGCGARMKLVVNMMMGINMVALCEGLAMGQKAGLKGEDIMEVIGQGAINSPMYAMKGPKMLKGEFDPAFPLKHQQ